MSETIDQRFAEEVGKIKVRSYQKTASVGGWSGGGRTMWAIAAFGTLLGAGIGVVAPFFPLIAIGATAASISTAVAAIPASVAAFAATGLGMGFGGGLMLGRMSGVAGAVAEEQEERLKQWTAKQILHQNPGARLAPDVEPDPPINKPTTLRDKYHTYVNPRVGLLFTAIGVAGGLIIGAAAIATGGASAFAIMPALEAITGLSAATLAQPAVTLAYTAGVCGSIGALWSFNVPRMASALTEYTGNLISGKSLGREWGPKPHKSIAPVKEPEQPKAVSQDEAIADAILAESRFSKDHHKSHSYQDRIARRQAEENAALLKR